MDWRTRSVAYCKVALQSNNLSVWRGGRTGKPEKRTHINRSKESRVHGDIEALGEKARPRCRELHRSLICLKCTISSYTHDSTRLTVYLHGCIPL